MSSMRLAKPVALLDLWITEVPRDGWSVASLI